MSENEVKGVALLTAGENTAACLRGNKLVWMVALDGGREGRVADLPAGVGASDVLSLSPSRGGVTLVTRSGDVHRWIDLGSGPSWRPPVNLFELAKATR